MKVIALGDIANKFLMDDLPERGVVIEATKEELQNLPPVLYRDVEVVKKKPPRNCDVGTAKEQEERYLQFCNSHTRGSCFGCPALRAGVRCEFAWAQMPYEEGETK